MTIEQKLRDEYRIGFLDGFADGYEESYKEGCKEGYEEIIKKAIIAVKDLLEPAVIAECYKLPLEQVIDIINQEQPEQAGTA